MEQTQPFLKDEESECNSEIELALQRAYKVQNDRKHHKGHWLSQLEMIDIHIALAGMEGPPLEELVVPDTLQWDWQLGMPLIQMSFLLNHLVPRRHIPRLLTQWTSDILMAPVQEVFSAAPELQLENLGSLSEGLAVPPYTKRSHINACKEISQSFLDKIDTLSSDSDLCIIASEKKVGLEPGDGVSYWTEMEDSYPGYCRLVAMHPRKVHPEYLAKAPSSPKYYLKNTEIKKRILSGMITHENENPLIHGPAVTIEVKDNFLSRRVENDFVFALPCVKWPEDAARWLHREPKSGWPSAEFKQTLIAEGCLMVAASHHTSKWPQVEWRISLAKAERALLNSLSDVHRQCVILLKMLLKHVLEPSHLISSYNIKTLLLWTCEKYPASIWQDKEVGLAMGFLLLLDELIHAIACQELPHYFFTANNLFSKIQPDFMAYMGKRVCWLRSNVAKAVFSFDKKYIFSFSPRCTTLERVFQPMMKGELECHQNVEKAYATCMKVLFALAKAHLSNGNVDDMIDSYREACQIQRVVSHQDIDFIPVTLNFAHKAPTIITIKTYEHLIRRFPSDRHIASLKGNLASLYHNSYYDDSVTDPDKEGMLKRADALYKEVIAHSRATASNWTDFANYLLKESMFHEAATAAQKSIEMFRHQAESMNSYSDSDRFTVPDDIRQDIEKDKTLAVKSNCFSSYLLVLSCIKLEKEDEAVRHIKQLQTSNALLEFTDLKLVGYAYKALQRYEEARDCFKGALELEPKSKASMDAMVMCEAWLQSATT